MSDEIESKFEVIKELMANILESVPDDLTEDTKFEDLDLDSLDVIELVMAVEDHYTVSIPDKGVAGLTTPKAVIDAVNKLKDA